VTFDDLHKNPFFELVMHDTNALMKSMGYRNFDGPDETTNFNELQFYVQRVGFALSHTFSWVQQLHQAVHFLTDFGYGKRSSNVRIDRAAHLLFNIENYLIRLQSTYDRCLQLTNNVFHLCMNDEHVGHTLIVSNLHVARTQVPKALKAVRKTLEKHSQARHQLVHRHSHIDDELRKIELMYLPTKETWPNDEKLTFERLVVLRAYRSRQFTIRKKAEFKAINSALVSSLEPLFAALLIEYNRQKSRLERLT